MASDLEFGLSFSIIARFRISKGQIVVGRGVFRIHGDDFLEFRDSVRKLPAFGEVIPDFEDRSFEIWINGCAPLEFRQSLLRYALSLVDRAKIKVNIGFIVKKLRNRLEAG